MTACRSVRLPVLLALLAALPVAAPSAFADAPVAASAKGTSITADAGYAAWRADDGHVVVRAGDRAPRETNLKPPAGAILDVGPRAGGGAQLVYADGCSARRHVCVVRGAALRATGVLSARVMARIPYRGGGSPALAVDGARLAYAVHGTTGSGKRRTACDVPYVRLLSARGASTRKLDRGHCAAIAQLDVGDGRVAILAHPALTYGTGATEARVVKLGGGRSLTLQREAEGEESNYIGAIALDHGALYTARGGIRQANVFTRIALGSRRRTDARAFVSLEGAFARDGGRSYYLQALSYEGSTQCAPGADAPGCLIVAGSDPFATTTRQLAPELALAAPGQPVYVDAQPVAVATLTRRTVTRTAVTARAAVPGVRVELLSGTPATRTSQPGPLLPFEPRTTTETGADGTARIPVPGPPQPYLVLAAVTRPAEGGDPAGDVQIPTSATSIVPTYVHLTASTERLADGRLRVSGTISPAQPGRKVRLDRKLQRLCKGVAFSTIISPSEVGVPTGCFDRYTEDPVTTAAVSADGGTYTLEAAAPAGTYRVALDFAGGAPVFPGESGAVEAG